LANKRTYLLTYLLMMASVTSVKLWTSGRISCSN